MSNFPVFTEIVTPRIPADCLTSDEVIAEKPTSGQYADSSYVIEFPSNVTTLPLAGGAVVSISIGSLDMDITPTAETRAINDVKTQGIDSGFKKIKKENSLDFLSEFHVEVNKQLFDIAKKNHKIIKGGIRSPNIYISAYFGNPGEVEQGVFLPDMRKICELKYIPYEAIQKIFNSIKDDLINPVVGIAGRKFKDLIDIVNKADDQVTNQNISDLVLELFPIVNLSEDEILLSRSGGAIETIFGGYYTIKNDRFFLKLPDLSGRDSSQNCVAPLSNEDRLFFEILSSSITTRIEISNFKFPPVAYYNSRQYKDFITQDLNIEVEFKLLNNEGSDINFYISPVLKLEDIFGNLNAKYIFEYTQEIEPFTSPVLTKPLEEGRQSIVDVTGSAENFNIFDFKNLDAVKSNSEYFRAKYLPESKLNILNIGDYGLPTIIKDTNYSLYPDKLKVNIDKALGIQNRPEVLLSNNGVVDEKNDKRYHSPSSYGKINILASKMPKFYKNNLSAAMSKAPEVLSDTEPSGEDFYVAKIPYSEVKGLKFGEEYKYVAYVVDNLGQVSKVNGFPITINYPIPEIEYIVPNGYNESEPIFAGTPSSDIILEETEDTILEVGITGYSPDSSIIFNNIKSGIKKIISIQDDRIKLSDAKDSFTINLGKPGYFYQELGVVSSQSLRVYIDTNGQGNYKLIYISINKDDPRPSEPLSPVNLDLNSFWDIGYQNIPLFKDGTSSRLSIFSKKLVFDGVLYAYLGFPSDEENINQIIRHFELSENIYTLDQNIIIPAGIVWEIGDSPGSDFYRDPIFKKEAYLKIPGNEYSEYNFSSLDWIKKAYIVITNAKINEISSASRNITSSNFLKDDFSYGLLTIGGEGNYAFIPPYTILDIAIRDSSSKVIKSTFERSKYEQAFSDNDIFLESDTFEVGKNLSVTGKIKELCLIIADSDGRNIDLYIDDVKVPKNKIYNKPKKIDSGKVLLTYKNIVPETNGYLDITIDKVGSLYNKSRYKARGHYSFITGLIKRKIDEERFSYNIKDNELTVLVDVVASEYTSDALITGQTEEITGIIGLPNQPSYIESTVYNRKNGAIFKNEYISDNLVPYNSLSLKSSAYISLDLNKEATSIQPQLAIPDVAFINSKKLAILSTATFPPRSWVDATYSSGEEFALVFAKLYTEGLNTIAYNVPKLISIRDELGVEIQESGLVAGRVYTFEFSSVDDNFSVVIAGTEIVPREINRNNAGNYEATIVIPQEVLNQLGGEVRVVVCASSTNTNQNNALKKIGEKYDEFVQNADNFVEGLPLVSEIEEIIKRVPLYLAGIKLDLPAPARQVAQSFCDYSFDLIKELKFALNDFRLLMIPVQVIFGIIDVLCALVNPPRLAKALIRLFQSLYDLVNLIPPISVPVMFMQTMLHLFELIKCVFDKIIKTIKTIDYLIQDLVFACRKPFTLRSVKEIEQTIEELLRDIELDLKVLDPIVSILAVFLDLLQIVFRFPCTIAAEDDSLDCGIDGTIIGGLVTGTAIIDSEVVPDLLIPVAQFYSTDDVEGSMNSTYREEYAVGDVVADDSNGSYYDSMNIDSETLRANSAYDFNPTLAPSFTKTNKRGKKTGRVSFDFDYRSKNKNIDYNQTADSKLAFFAKNNSEIVVAEFGNLYSAIDGEDFLVIDLDKKKASVKPLVLTFEIPIMQPSPDTGELVQTGVQNITRTFDNIPKMAIIDEEANLYFIEEEGIEYSNDGFVKKIFAKIINASSATKYKASKEDNEILQDDGSVVTIEYFDFSRIFFFDMRNIADDLKQYCVTSSINSLPFEEDNTQDILDIVGTAKLCIESWQNNVNTYVQRIRNRSSTNLQFLPNLAQSGILTGNSELEDCVSKSIDDICKYVVNTLNTSFKILEDRDFTRNEGFVNGDISTEVLDGFPLNPNPLTGAREYAAGVGNDAIIRAGESATIELIPRDAFNNIMTGDLSDRIFLEIISDSTGSGVILTDENQKIFTKLEDSYVAKVTSSGEGRVRLRAKVCDRTIQALTYQGTDVNTNETETEIVDGCLPQSPSVNASQIANINILTKVDRILTIYFIKRNNNITSIIKDSEDIITNPQEFGTSLEN